MRPPPPVAPNRRPHRILAALVAALAGAGVAATACREASPTPAGGGGGAATSAGGAGGASTSTGAPGGGDAGQGGAPVGPPPADASVEDPSLFLAGELLGRPTATSVTVNVVPAKPIDAFLELGTAPGAYPMQTSPALRPAADPFTVKLEGLAPDTAYVYRLRWRKPGDPAFAAGPDRAFHTQRPPGATFRFTLQADSHLDENSDLDLYHRTLDNVLADAGDFHLDLGDTFMCEKHSAPLTAAVEAAPDEPTVLSRYLYERAHFGRAAHSVPLFLVNGNHDGELGYLFKGQGDDLATWTKRARQRFYLNPTPDDFYAGDPTEEPVVGERAAFCAWTWGDASFVALDPFWNAKVKPGASAWGWTLGEKQDKWLADVLAKSQSKYKFVFLHNLVGGLDGQMGGGVEAAPFFEWGGADPDGTPAFAKYRPGWAKPIHALLVDTKVSVFFQAHDHLFARETVDGVVYQEVPNPADNSYFAYNCDAYAPPALAWTGPAGYGTYDPADAVRLPNTGFLDVTVSEAGVHVEYVRTYRDVDLQTNPNKVFTGKEKNGEARVRVLDPSAARRRPGQGLRLRLPRRRQGAARRLGLQPLIRRELRRASPPGRGAAMRVPSSPRHDAAPVGRPRGPGGPAVTAPEWARRGCKATSAPSRRGSSCPARRTRSSSAARRAGRRRASCPSSR